MTELAAINLMQDIAFPPSEVWRALTEPALMEKWWAKGDIAPEVGREFSLDMGTFGEQRCKVLVAEPERVLSYTFGEGMLDTTITWRLEPAENGEGTVLYLEQAGFDLESPMGGQAFQGMSRGWPALLPRIEAALAEQQ